MPTIIILSLIFQQTGFAQSAARMDLSGYLSGLKSNFTQDVYRPCHLRYFSYDNLTDNFKLLVEKGYSGNGTAQGPSPTNDKLKQEANKLLEYFLTGVSLQDDMFWVNLRPDSQDQIIDNWLEKTDVGKIMLEADVQLKKDTAMWTSPETAIGRKYWDKLYKKAAELYGYDNVTIPTLTRPWIVPGEIIVKEAQDSAYIYKATLKVMLEEDYIKSNSVGEGLASSRNQNTNNLYEFNDPRAKELNTYSTQLIREMIIPKLTKEVNSSKKYAALRQVYYSLILSRWFKHRFSAQKAEKKTGYVKLIDSRNLTNLTSLQVWSKETYYKQYQKSFAQGEYNIKEPVSTPTGQVIRSYFSGGVHLASSAVEAMVSLTDGSIPQKLLKRQGTIFMEGRAFFLQNKRSQVCVSSSMGKNSIDKDKNPQNLLKKLKKAEELIDDIIKKERLLTRDEETNINQLICNALRYRDEELNQTANNILVKIINFYLDEFQRKEEDKQREFGEFWSVWFGLERILWQVGEGREDVLKIISYGLWEQIPKSEKLPGSINQEVIDVFKRLLSRSLWCRDVPHGVYLIIGMAKIKNMRVFENEKEEKSFLARMLAGLIQHFLVLSGSDYGNPEEAKKAIIVAFRVIWWDKLPWLIDCLRQFINIPPEELAPYFNPKYIFIDDVKRIFQEMITGLDELLTSQLNQSLEEKKIAGLLGLDESIINSSPMQTTPVPERIGAIDFRGPAMNINYEVMGSFKRMDLKLPRLSESQLNKINIDSEIRQIKQMVSSGISLSGARLEEIAAACEQKGKMSVYGDDLLLCIVRACGLAEANGEISSRDFITALARVDSRS